MGRVTELVRDSWARSVSRGVNPGEAVPDNDTVATEPMAGTAMTAMAIGDTVNLDQVRVTELTGDMAFHVQPPDGGTSHFVAADRDGDVASLTSTIESVWGSGLTVNGYFLNNELTDFSFAPERDGAPVIQVVLSGSSASTSIRRSSTVASRSSSPTAIKAARGSQK